MKKTRILTALIASALVVLTVLSGCDMLQEETMTPGERMKEFVSDANAGNWGSLKEHTHPDADDYDTANASFWESEFDPYGTLGNPSTIGTTSTVVATGATFVFTLEEDGKNFYKIRRIVRNGSTRFE